MKVGTCLMAARQIGAWFNEVSAEQLEGSIGPGARGCGRPTQDITEVKRPRLAFAQRK